MIGRESCGHLLEVDLVEYLLEVEPAVLRSEELARALADAQASVLAVLQLAHGGRGCQLPVVLVGDSRLAQRGLQAQRVCPRVLAAAHTAALADVQPEPDDGP